MRQYRLKSGNTTFTVGAKSFEEAVEKINSGFELCLNPEQAEILSVVSIN